LVTDTGIQVWFGTKPIAQTDVQAWETKRAAKQLRSLGAPVSAGDLTVLRKALLDTKIRIGRDAIEQKLAREVAVSDRVTGALARWSGRRRRLSQVEIFVPGAKADQLPTWYAEHTDADDEASFLEACPDHHLFRTVEGRGQEVWETTGGSPFASRFSIDLTDSEGLITPIDPSYPIQMAGAARLNDGRVLGGIRHQLRDETDGARVLLTVEFPWLIGPAMPAAHRWHLACEFTTWLEAAHV
jgi:hypothetical protein